MVKKKYCVFFLAMFTLFLNGFQRSDFSQGHRWRTGNSLRNLGWFPYGKGMVVITKKEVNSKILLRSKSIFVVFVTFVVNLFGKNQIRIRSSSKRFVKYKVTWPTLERFACHRNRWGVWMDFPCFGCGPLPVNSPWASSHILSWCLGRPITSSA